MSQKKYTYHFPENKAYKNGLNSEDMAVIANNTGYSKGTVEKMLNGHRKLVDIVKDECIRVAHLNLMKFKNQQS